MLPHYKLGKRRSNPGLPMANRLRARDPLERRDTGQEVSTSDHFKRQTRRDPSGKSNNGGRVGNHERRRRRRAIRNSAENNNRVRIGSKGYGPYQEDL